MPQAAIILPVIGSPWTGIKIVQMLLLAGQLVGQIIPDGSKVVVMPDVV